MAIDDFIKERAEMLMWVVHIGVGLWIMGDGNILSKQIDKIFIYIALGVSLYIFIKLHKALISEQSKPPIEVRIEKKPEVPKPAPFEELK